MIKRISPFMVAAFTLAAVILQCGDAAAQRRSFIRDSEIENTIRAFATPVFQVAGLNPSVVEVYLVNDPSLNAFVAGGQKLFINTGLLMNSENPGQVIGVIAHETGHIAGGHLSQTQDALAKSTAQQILATVVGAAATVATGRGDVGAAVIAGVGSFLHYSRTQEGAADAAAARYLEASGQSAEGLLEFLQTLSDQELLSARHQAPYLRTHPLTRERILALEDHVSRSAHSRKPAPDEFNEMHARMKAKLLSFLEPPARTLRRYGEEDQSLPARYARAIAYYRKPDLDQALPIIDALIAEYPQDPYFHEMKGQMLFENARAAEALEPYETATRLLPHSSLIRLQLARIQLERNDPALIDSAIKNLRMAEQREPGSASIWRSLAIAYGRKGDMGMSALSMAEAAYFRGNQKEARYHATRAKDTLPAGSPAVLQAEDILKATEKKKDGGG